METIYDWLLHNVGNEGNYFTVMDARRLTGETGLSGIDAMVRDKDFKLLHLLIRPGESDKKADYPVADTAGTKFLNTYFFDTGQSAIAYISMGTVTATDVIAPAIRIVVLAPADAAGGTTFP